MLDICIDIPIIMHLHLPYSRTTGLLALLQHATRTSLRLELLDSHDPIFPGLAAQTGNAARLFLEPVLPIPDPAVGDDHAADEGDADPV